MIRAIRDACERVDEGGRLHPEDVPEARLGVVELLRSGVPLEHPDELFGPWRDLPPAAQTALRRAVETELRIRMDFHPHGRLWVGLTRASRDIDRWLSEHRGSKALRSFVYLSGGRIWVWPRRASDLVRHRLRIRRWRRARRPRVEDVLAAVGRDAQWLMGDFAEGVRIDARCRGFFHDPSRNVVYGYLLGVDLALTDHGAVCFESNLNAGLIRRVREPLWDRDPVAVELAAFAELHGFRRVIWVGGIAPLDPWLYRQIRDELGARSIEFRLLEDPRFPRRTDIPADLPAPGRTLFPPTTPPRDTLVVRIGGYRLGSDRIVSEKDSFSRAIGRDLAAAGETRVAVHPLRMDPGSVTLPSDPGVPNLVYKYPEANQGTGVFFLRARDAAHARELAREIDRRTRERGGLFEPWTASRELPGRFAEEFRSMLLVSPVGVHWMGAYGRITRTPMPDKLAEGIVEDRAPFIRTGHFGNASVRVRAEDQEPLREASLALGESIVRVLRRGFETSPAPEGQG